MTNSKNNSCLSVCGDCLAGRGLGLSEFASRLSLDGGQLFKKGNVVLKLQLTVRGLLFLLFFQLFVAPVDVDVRGILHSIRASGSKVVCNQNVLRD